jgi:hypothetical protein
MVQPIEQPSPDITLPSSQPSLAAFVPSPQRIVQTEGVPVQE